MSLPRRVAAVAVLAGGGAGRWRAARLWRAAGRGAGGVGAYRGCRRLRPDELVQRDRLGQPAMPGVTLRLPSGGDRLELVLAPDDPGVRLRRRAVPAHHTVHS